MSVNSNPAKNYIPGLGDVFGIAASELQAGCSPGVMMSAPDTGAANAYAIAPTPVITAYAAGQMFNFVPANANSTAATLAVNGLAAKAIKKWGSAALAAGDLNTTSEATVIYDGTNFQLLNPQGDSFLHYFWADSGAANAYVITPVPAITALVAGQSFQVKISADNTGASTLNVSGLGVKSIKKTHGTADPAAGDLKAGGIYTLTYDGTVFQIVGGLG